MALQPAKVKFRKMHRGSRKGLAYRGSTVKQAAETVILDELKSQGGEGGVITMDRAGNIAMPFNSVGMYRASIDVDGHVSVAIF